MGVYNDQPIVYGIMVGCMLTILIAIYFLGVFYPTSNLFFNVVTGKEFFGDHDGILLRFDDGPNPQYTPKILDILKKHQIKSFFAVTGENAKQHPDIIKRIVNESHLIGNHSYSHSYLISTFNAKKLFDEIMQTNQVIENITQVKPTYFCMPIGHKSLALRQVLKQTNMKGMSWDIRSHDTHFSKEKIIEQVKSRLKNKSIILFHDGVYKWTHPDRLPTIDSLEDIIAYIKESGYCFYDRQSYN